MPLPSVIGKYQVVDRLGQGGMGTLYLARDPYLDRLVAIKVLRVDFDDEELRDRFAREARAVSRLSSHQNIVTIFEYGSFEGQPFIAMQYVAGESLAELIHRRATLPIDRKLRIVDEVCAGMAAAHRLKIVHRDLKPANIMIDADSGLVKILDFGIARNLEANVTLHTQVIGTPSYMSPEQASGLRVDHRSDIFAIGAVAYELFSYRKAFDGESTGEIQRKILEQQPAPLERLCPGIDPGLIGFVEKALEKDPANRYQDLEAARLDLGRVADRLAQTAAEPTIVVTPPGASKAAAHTPQPSPHLEQRRASQIKRLLEAAQSAFREKDYEAAVESCEHVLLLDATHREALALLQQTRKAIDRLAIERYVSDARRALEAGLLTDADRALSAAAKLDSGDPSVVALQRTLQQARQEMERALERAAAAEAALSRARSSFENGALESALRATSEALAHKPDSSDALALKERITRALEQREREREQERAALNVVRDARAQFERGQHTVAIRSLETASPPHALIAAALEELRAQREALEAKRRAEELRRRIAQLAATSEARLAAADFDAALDAVAAIEHLDTGAPEVADLRTRVIAARAAAAERERLSQIDALLKASRASFAAANYAEALDTLAEAERFGAPGRELNDLRARIVSARAEAKAAAEALEQRRARRDAAIVAGEQLFHSGDLDNAKRQADAALALDGADDRARQLLAAVDRAVAERKRQEVERAAAAERVRKESEEAQRRAEADRRRRLELDAQLAETERLLSARMLDEALRAAEAAVALDPADGRATRLVELVRSAIVERVRADADAERARREAEAERRRREEEERQQRAEAEAAAAALKKKQRQLESMRADARRLLAGGKLEKAQHEIDAALALDGADAQAHQLRDQIRAAFEDRARAEEQERKARAEEEARRSRLETLIATSRTLVKSADYDGALTTLSEAERLDPKSRDVTLLRTQIRTRRDEEAAAAEAAKKRQREIEARIAEARRLLDAGKLDKASREVDAALGLDGADGQAQQLRDQIHAAVEHRARAEAEQRKAQAEEEARRRKEEEARRSRLETLIATSRTLVKSADYDGALTTLSEAERLDPKSRDVTLLRTQIHTRRDEEAAAAEALRKRRQSVESKIVASAQLLSAGQLEKAQREVDAALGLDGADVQAQQLHAQIRTALEARARAEAEARKARAEEEPKSKTRPAWIMPAIAGALLLLALAIGAIIVRSLRNNQQTTVTSIPPTTVSQQPVPVSPQTSVPQTPAQTPVSAPTPKPATPTPAAAATPKPAPAVSTPTSTPTPAAPTPAAPTLSANATSLSNPTPEPTPPPPPNPTPSPALGTPNPALVATPTSTPTPTAVIDPVTADKQAIQRLLRRYEDAYNRMDAGALSKLDRSIPKDAFRYTQSYHVVLNNVSIDVSGDQATVKCERQIEQVAKRGSKEERSDQKVDTNIRLRRSGAEWLIESVSAK